MNDAHSTSEAASLEKIEQKQGLITYLIFLQTLLAMLGSLYFSTFGDPVKNLMARTLFPQDNGLLPCELCWFARILMYPMVLISIVGILKGDRRFTDYLLPLSVIGMGLEIFHYGLQKFSFANPFGCTLTNPCNALQVQYLGFITIPFLALIGFTIITGLCLKNWKLNRQIDTLKGD